MQTSKWRVFTRGRFLTGLFALTLPLSIGLGLGKLSIAANFFWAGLCAMLFLKFLGGRRDEVFCLVLAVAPFINLLRGFAFYNVIVFLLGAVVFYYFMCDPGSCLALLKRNPLVLAACIYIGGYYALSFRNTGDYSINIRLFEFILTIFIVLILGRDPLLLGTALLGMIISACLVGLTMLPHIRAESARLGLVEIEGNTLGNPAQLGVPLAFGLLAIATDRGRWLCLEHNGLIRVALLLVILPLLFLTTSRASWLVAATGVLISFLLGSRQRLKILLFLVLGIAAGNLVLASPYGQMFNKGLERTFSDKRSMRQRTSGRSDQWRVAMSAFTASLDKTIRGYGPGTGPAVYARKSLDIDGVKYGVGKRVALHSLFMQTGVEAGIIGLLLIFFWLAVIGARTRLALRQGFVLPLICISSYLIIVMTISGYDTNSGVFLGLALLGGGVNR